MILAAMGALVFSVLAFALLARALRVKQRDARRNTASTRALAENEERLRLAQTAGGTGIGAWDWDLARDQVTRSGAVYGKMGLAPARRVPSGDFLRAEHPEDTGGLRLPGTHETIVQRCGRMLKGSVSTPASPHRSQPAIGHGSGDKGVGIMPPPLRVG